MNLKKLKIFSLLSFFIITIAIVHLIENIVPFRTVKPNRMNFEDEANCLPKGINAQDYDLRQENFTITGFEGIQLSGFILKSIDSTVQKSNTTLIMLHGNGGFKENFLLHSEYLTKKGITVAAIDLRGHGKSSGEFCTFGEKEKYDVQSLVSWLIAKDTSNRIGIFGSSLGGAIAIQSLEIDKRIQFGIIESTFHDLEKVVEEFGQNFTGIRSPNLAKRVLNKASKIANFNPFEIKPYLSAEKVFQPVLVVHGDKDSTIPPEFGRVNFDHFASTKKEWYIVKDGKHRGIWLTAGEVYWKKIADFCLVDTK